MKIFAIINNYASEAESIFGGNEPDWYEMPDSSILRSGNPFFVPDFADEFKVYPSVAYRIGRLGKSISPRFAYRYIDGYTLAGAVIAPGLLRSLRNGQRPWTRAVSFDRSCLLGNLEPIDTLKKNEVFRFACGGHEAEYSIGALLRGVDEIISMISADNTLKNGDLILAGLSPEGLSLRPDTRLTASKISETNIIDINIR